MLRSIKRLILGGAVVALGLVLTGCGESTKDANPKVVNPDAQKELPKQAPPPIGGGPAQKQNAQAGVN